MANHSLTHLIMAVSIASLLQGGSQPAVNGVKQVTGSPAVSGIQLQGASTVPVQGSTLSVQGSSPTLQGSSPILQPTVNPQTLPTTATIHVPSKPVTAAPAAPAPALPTALAPANPTGASTAAPVLPDRSNDISQNQAALAASNSMLTNGLSSIHSSLTDLLGKYGSEGTANEATYGTQSDTNKGNFLKNMQSALLNAAQGRQGLFGVLASLGALNGSGVDLANHAVQSGANADISGANDTFATNQSGLDTSIGEFRTADQQRKDQADKDAAAQEQALRAQVAGNQQSIYGNLANDYSDMGNAGQSKQYSDLLASLFPTIAANSVPSSGPSYSAANFTAPALSSYLSGGTTVNSTPSSGLGGLPGLLAYTAPSKKKTA